MFFSKNSVSDQLLIVGSERRTLAAGEVSFAHLPRVFLRQPEGAPLLADVCCL